MQMKRILVGFMCFGLSHLAFTQSNELLTVTSFKLSNGFTVFLNEDTTTSKIFGAVIVNAGAKNESSDATGMAHYLEHLLFKGTNQLGTSDYAKEKPYLDSINVLYDKLASTSDPDQQDRLQRAINDQAQKASEYGLPSEFDKLLRSIGSTGINAFTNYEMTFYHNSFPSHEIEKWLDLYAIRFQHPVFRSFQSELEVVYEEKNRALDNMERKVYETTERLVLPNLPYGQWSVLGEVEHLKKPSLSKMYDFYNKNYTAGNMALILTGNFWSADVIPLIEDKFSQLKEGSTPKIKLPIPTPLTGGKVEKVRITPVKAGFLGWQTMAQTHPDRMAMDVCEYLLFNNSETGFINQIQLNNQMIYAGAFSNVYNEAGDFVIFFVPKVIIQSMGNAEKMIEDALNKVKNGDFSDEMLVAAKYDIDNAFQRRLENLRSRGVMIGNAFNLGVSWEEYVRYPEKVRTITREDVMQVAKTYLGDNKVKMISRTGFPKKVKLQKPPYKPVTPDQKASSIYAEKFARIPAKAFQPKYLNFDKDVDRVTINGNHEIFAVRNPLNDLFTLEIRFKTGSLKTPSLPAITGLINYAGAGSYLLTDFKQAFAALGCSYYIGNNNNFLTVGVSGSEASLDKALDLIDLLLTRPKVSERAINLLYNEVKTGRKVDKRDRYQMGRALLTYAVYGNRSSLLQRNSTKEIKQMVAQDMAQAFKEIVSNYQSEIVFIGSTPISDLKKLIDDKLSLAEESKVDSFIAREKQQVPKNKILFVHDKNAVQSQIYFYVPGETMNQDDYHKAVSFNEYFGGGFSGLVMQEIREYRSLAYATGANYSLPELANEEASFLAYIGCQGDKTNDAIGVMVDLIKNMPEKPDRIPSLRSSLQLKVVTNYPNFRNIPNRIIDYRRQGFTEDPNINAYNKYHDIKMTDIVDFYQKNIKGKPYVITIYGDKRKINLESLKQFGEIIEMDLKDVVKF
jgi:predicted Zn-dependent peptidase